MCMHERHVRECCLWLITSRTATFQPPINKTNPAGFQRLCRGDSGSPVPPGSSCSSPWPLGGLSSDPPILWEYVKVEGELIGQPWLLIASGGSHFAPVIQPSPESFLSPLKTMTSCVPQRKAEESLAHRGLIPDLAIWPLPCSPSSIS